MKKSGETPVKRLLDEFRGAESRDDLEAMTYICGRLISTSLSMAHFHAAKRYINLFNRLKEGYISTYIPKKAGIFGPIRVSERIETLSKELEDAVYLLSYSARDLRKRDSINEARKYYELAVMLSRSRLGIQFIEEVDIVDDLAVVYLISGKYKKALQTFALGATHDQGRSIVTEFCSNYHGPLPRTLKKFLRKSPDDFSILKPDDPWSKVGG